MRKAQKGQIFLPTTEKEFDKLIELLVKTFKLPSKDHCAAVVANRIMHLPPEQATTTLEYLGHCVLKNMAFQVAQAKGSQVTHKAQVDAIANELKTNPLNQQALDALDKAVKEGSPYAKSAQEDYLKTNHINLEDNLTPLRRKDAKG